MEGRRPTQWDVGKAAGVHRTTVSLVFKNHYSIPKETKKKVRECAARLGYVPDPMLSSLAAYRSRNRSKSFQGVLAWLTNDLPGMGIGWKDIPNARKFYEGAAARAQVHGYRLQIFDLNSSGISPARLASIFHSRNIQGILLPPQMKADVSIQFPWEEFSAVTFGYSLISPQLHTITSTQFRSTVKTMRHLREHGYERIGFFFTHDHDHKTDHNYLAGYLTETFTAGHSGSIPPLFLSEYQHEEFLKWFQKYRPDALITGNRDILLMMDALKIRVPEDLGIASPLLWDPDSRMAGVYEDSFQIGEVAMDFLVAMVQRGERGVPRLPQRVHVEGTWIEGSTLRKIPRGNVPGDQHLLERSAPKRKNGRTQSRSAAGKKGS